MTGLKTIAGVTVLAGLMVLTGCQTPKQARLRELPVKTQAVAPGLIEDSSRFVGNLEALERVALRPQINGRITQIAVTNGTPVRPGTLIARLEPDQTATELAAAQARVQSAQQAVQQAQANLRAARSQRTAAQATLELQKREYQRAVSLLAEGVISQQDKDTATRNLEVAQANLQAAADQVKAAEAALQQAQSNLRQAQAQASTARVSFDFKTIAAPIAGVVSDVPVRVGDVVQAGQVLTHIVKNDVLDLRIAVPTSRLQQLRLDLPVILEDPSTNQTLAQGRIYFIAPDVDTNAQTVLTKAQFRNPQGRLRDGQFVQARVIWDRQPGLLVPVLAVSPLGAQPFVFTVARVNGKTIARQKPVQLGNIQGPYYHVRAGLTAGEQVIVSGLLGLTDGAPIRPEAVTATTR